MKKLLTAALLFITTLIFGQNSEKEEAAIFLDSNLVPTNTIKYIPAEEIESVHVDKKNVRINGKSYAGQIHITSNNPTKYDFISLDQIKSDYTDIKKSDVIYMINGEFMKENSATFKLDRHYILTVEVTNSSELYNFRKSDTKFDIINILGKTKENLDNKNKILLRGYESIGIK